MTDPSPATNPFTGVPHPAPASPNRPVRRYGLMSVAAVALVAAGVVGGNVLDPRAPAVAQAPIAVPVPNGALPPSFADVVQAVKPAVVSVRVRIGGPDVPLGNPQDPRLRRWFERQQFFGEPDMDEGYGGESLRDRLERRFGQAPNGPRPGPGPRGGPRRFGESQGSGFFVSTDGYIVTNNHVVENATEVSVVTDDGRTLPARVVGRDARTDLAVIRVTEGGNFPYVRFAAGAPRVGDWVMAVGNPFGLGGTVTAGIVSARGRDIGAGVSDDFLQIDAAVNRGNSGGPTFNLQGEVVGVNTAIVSPSGGNVGIAFAVPSETATRVVTALQEGREVQRGFLGVSIQPVSPPVAEALGLREPRGALVAAVQPGTPAETAGMRPGDVILSVNGDAVRDGRDLSRRVSALPPDSEARLAVWRSGREETLTIKLGRLASADAGQRPAAREGFGGDGQRLDPRGEARREQSVLGLSFAPAREVRGAGREGLVVTRVGPEAPGGEGALREGDVILEAAGRAVETPADIRSAVEAARRENRRAVLMRVRSGEATRFVAVPIQAG